MRVSGGHYKYVLSHSWSMMGTDVDDLLMCFPHS